MRLAGIQFVDNLKWFTRALYCADYSLVHGAENIGLGDRLKLSVKLSQLNELLPAISCSWSNMGSSLCSWVAAFPHILPSCHTVAPQKRLRFKTTTDATEAQVTEAMKKIASHIKNPSKFGKASKLAVQLIQAGSVKAGTSDQFFAILEAAMSSPSACTDPSLRADYQALICAAQGVDEVNVCLHYKLFILGWPCSNQPFECDF